MRFLDLSPNKQLSDRIGLSQHTLAFLLKGLLLLVILAVLVYHLTSLETAPPLFIDEAWNANTAWNWLQTGNNFDSMHAGTLDQYGNEWLRWPILGNWPWRLSYAILGLGLFQARVVSWIFGVILTGLTVLVGRRLVNWTTGLVAALFLVISAPFFQASHYGRWDMMLTAFAMCAFWLALTGMESGRWWHHTLAGLLVGVAIDIHQNAILFMVGFLLLYLARYGIIGMFKQKGTWWFALGAALGLAYFFALFILPDPDAYFGLFSLSLGNTHVMPITTLNPIRLLQSVDDEIGRYHFFDNNLDFGLLGAAVIYLILRREQHDRLLLWFTGAVFAAFVLIIGNKHDIYAILLYPWFMLITAVALVGLVQERPQLDRAAVFGISLICLFVLTRGVILNRAVKAGENYSYEGIIAQIEPHIPNSEARIMGLPDWWLGLADYDYRSSLNLTYYHILNGYSLTEGLEEVRPDVIILDRDLQALLVDDGAYQTGAGFAIYQLPRSEFEAFLAQRGEKAVEFWDPWHGWFEIYIIDWS